jgi:hypothetical protein
MPVIFQDFQQERLGMLLVLNIESVDPTYNIRWHGIHIKNTCFGLWHFIAD